MSYSKLENLIAEFPEERTAIEALVNLIQGGKNSAQSFEIPFNRIYEKTNFHSSTALAKVLTKLVSDHMIVKILRVSSGGQGLKDFESITEIPEVIHDIFTDRDVTVTPDNIEVIYKF